jgi:hypothetical protein
LVLVVLCLEFVDGAVIWVLVVGEVVWGLVDVEVGWELIVHDLLIADEVCLVEVIALDDRGGLVESGSSPQGSSLGRGLLQ